MAKIGPVPTEKKKPELVAKIASVAVEVLSDTLESKILGITESPVHSAEYKLHLITQLLK